MTGLFIALLIGEASAGDATAGQAVYMANCMACHGQKADGNGPASAALQPKPTDFTSAAYWSGTSDAAIKSAIKSGSPGTSMMGFAQLSDSDLNNVVAFLKTKKP